MIDKVKTHCDRQLQPCSKWPRQNINRFSQINSLIQKLWFCSYECFVIKNIYYRILTLIWIWVAQECTLSKMDTQQTDRLCDVSSKMHLTWTRPHKYTHTPNPLISIHLWPQVFSSCVCSYRSYLPNRCTDSWHHQKYPHLFSVFPSTQNTSAGLRLQLHITN